MTCTHHAENPEGIVWPVEVSLDHFDNCLDQEARLMTWRMTRQLADQASRCFQADHEGALLALHTCHEQIAILTHTLSRRARRSAIKATYRARARRRTRSHR
jgi:hypothetical protein